MRSSVPNTTSTGMFRPARRLSNASSRAGPMTRRTKACCLALIAGSRGGKGA